MTIIRFLNFIFIHFATFVHCTLDRIRCTIQGFRHFWIMWATSSFNSTYGKHPLRVKFCSLRQIKQWQQYLFSCLQTLRTVTVALTRLLLRDFVLANFADWICKGEFFWCQPTPEDSDIFISLESVSWMLLISAKKRKCIFRKSRIESLFKNLKLYARKTYNRCSKWLWRVLFWIWSIVRKVFTFLFNKKESSSGISILDVNWKSEIKELRKPVKYVK